MESSSSSLGGDRQRLGPAALSLPPVAANVGLLLVYDLAHRLALTPALLGAAFLGLLYEKLTPLRDEAWRRLPHAWIPTVYPPFSIAAFSIASRMPFPILCWKT